MAAALIEPNTNTGGRGLAWLGLVLAVAPIVAYAVQMGMKQLKTPWYLPVAGTLGAVLVLAALTRRRTAWRWAGLALFGFLAAVEWYFLLSFSLLPPYTGPVAAGKPMPDFTALRADGTSFTKDDLRGQKTALVFFRGRW